MKVSISRYYRERDKLLAAQKEERAILLAHGVKAEDIDKLHSADYDAWKANRVYANHNSISADEIGEEALTFAWLNRNRAAQPDELICGFLDSIGNEKLLAVLQALTPADLALVEACLVNGVTQEEYAAIVKKSRSAITRKLGRIKIKIAAAIKK
jgi:DNA-directed RNA polymerase specialized sigma24 family protein